MSKFQCSDLGLSCDFVATGNTVDEVKQKALTHASQKHPDIIQSQGRSQVEKLVVSKIK
jgi:predicted small metal-binding protein